MIIRSFQRSDQSECEKIFTDGFDEYVKTFTLALLSTVSWHFGIVSVFTSVTTILWSTWVVAVYAVVVFLFWPLSMSSAVDQLTSRITF